MVPECSWLSTLTVTLAVAVATLSSKLILSESDVLDACVKIVCLER